MGVDRELALKITTTADTAGTEKASQSLDHLQTKASDLGKGLGGLAESHEKSEKAAKESGESHHELHKLFKEMGENSVPELGHIMATMLDGSLAPALALGIAFSFLKEILNKNAEEVRKVREELAKIDASSWDNQRDAALAAREAADEYLRKLKEVESQLEAIKAVEEQTLALLEARQHAEEKINKAKETAELAEAEGDPVKQARIRARWQDKAEADALKNEQDKINLLTQQLGGRTADQPGFDARAAEAEKHLDEVTTDRGAAFTKAQLENATHKQSALDEKEAEFRDVNLDKLREELKTASTVSGDSWSPSEHQRLAEEIRDVEKARKDAADNRRTIEDFGVADKNHELAVKHAGSELSAAEKDRDENTAAIKALTQQIDTLTKVHEINTGADRVIKGEEAGQTFYGRALRAEHDDAAKIAGGHADQVKDASQQVISNLGALIAGHAVTLKQAAALVLKADSSKDAMLSALEAMGKTADAMLEYSQSTIKRLQKIEEELAILTANVKQTIHFSPNG